MMSCGPGLAFGAGGLRSRACALRTSLGSSPRFASFSHSSFFRLSFLALGTWCARMLGKGRVASDKARAEQWPAPSNWALAASAAFLLSTSELSPCEMAQHTPNAHYFKLI